MSNDVRFLGMKYKFQENYIVINQSYRRINNSELNKLNLYSEIKKIQKEIFNG